MQSVQNSQFDLAAHCDMLSSYVAIEGEVGAGMDLATPNL
jgi:hypothetical protein